MSIWPLDHTNNYDFIYDCITFAFFNNFDCFFQVLSILGLFEIGEDLNNSDKTVRGGNVVQTSYFFILTISSSPPTILSELFKSPPISHNHGILK
jgi:hypothetical protein